jgi:NAD(P)-dependent dehydrogenase (short-subunit alcohol dehydrogenase family)
VIALARTRGALAELDDEIRANGGAPASLIALNLADGERVDALGPSLYSRFGGLDVFVGNAGSLGVLAPLAHTQTKDWQSVFDVNVGANWRLIRTLDPLLRRSAAGRAIFVTAGAAQERRAYWGPYAASKAALEALAMCYAREVASTSVRVNVVDPGRMRTGLRAAAYPGEPRENSPPPELLAPRFVDYACADCASHGEIIRL